MSNPWTPGPWGWFGDTKMKSLYLATQYGGRHYVMDFRRWGTNCAQPRFNKGGLMHDASTLTQFAVGAPETVGHEAALAAPSVYRYDVTAIAHADARLIAAAPEMAEMLSETLRTLGYLRNELTGRIEGDAAIKFFGWSDNLIEQYSALLARIRGEQS